MRARRIFDEKLLDIFSIQKPVLGVSEENKRSVDAFIAEICSKNGIDPEPLLY